MKKLLFFTIATIFANNIFAQNVGIGTTTPTDKLSVVNTLPGYGITHTHGPVTMGTWISNLYGQFGTKTNHPLQFFTNNGAAQITLLQNGNTGIGVAAPTYKLQVAGNVFSQGNLAGFKFSDQSDNAKSYEWYSTGGNLYLSKQDAISRDVLAILGNGNVGFNLPNPQTNLHINPAGAGSILIGTNKNSGGYTNLEIGITSQSGGKSYIQSTNASGISYGDMHLNPNGGYLGINMPTTASVFAPVDIQQSIATRGLRLRNVTTATFQDFWDISSSDFLHFRSNNNLVAFINLAGEYIQVSDERLKKNTVRMESVLEKVMLLKPSKYEYINNNRSHKISSGLLAQEVMTVFPELVSDFKHPTSDTSDNKIYHAINYAGFGVIAIKAIQEQQTMIDALIVQNKLMMREIEKLKNK
jgi:hypothetical protein